MLLIYSDKDSNRLQYTLRMLFGNILGVEYNHTTQKEKFLRYQGPKLNYSPKAFSKEIFFKRVDLLFQKSIESFTIQTLDYEGSKAPFPVYDNTSYLPFDPFAASFYMLARYEEYLPYRKDEHGRFNARDSIAYRYRFLKKPVVNIWAYQIRKILKKRFPNLIFKKRKFKFIPTYDIDVALSYRSKGFIRSVGGYLKSLSNGEFKDIIHRTQVLLGQKRDPYDTYSYQINMHKKYGLDPIYFILFGKFGKYDKNLSVNNKRFQVLIKHLADYAELGIHPSYASSDNADLLRDEINKLSQVLNKEIKSSRMHYLKMDLPTTYRNLIHMEITDDYTMGFASELGFRAGTCDAFNFYDLDMETETNLRIHPFSIMEGTLRDYKGIQASEAIQYIKPLIDEVKSVDGTLISLWHNPSLNDNINEGGWRKPYEDMIKYAIDVEDEEEME